MNLIITSIEDSPFSYSEVVDLIHSSFEERLNQGLHFTCSTITTDQFKQKTEKGIVLVAWDNETSSLLGTSTVSIRKDTRGNLYGYHEYLAISPKAKRLGVGTKLLESHTYNLINRCGQYVLSDTAVGADSSVKWHVKNGFRIIGLRSFPSTNYYSYIFRKQLTPSVLWDSKYFTSVRTFISSILVKSLYNEDGSYTLLGEMTLRVIKLEK